MGGASQFVMWDQYSCDSIHTLGAPVAAVSTLGQNGWRPGQRAEDSLPTEVNMVNEE